MATPTGSDGMHPPSNAFYVASDNVRGKIVHAILGSLVCDFRKTELCWVNANSFSMP